MIELTALPLSAALTPMRPAGLALSTTSDFALALADLAGAAVAPVPPAESPPSTAPADVVLQDPAAPGIILPVADGPVARDAAPAPLVDAGRFAAPVGHQAMPTTRRAASSLSEEPLVPGPAIAAPVAGEASTSGVADSAAIESPMPKSAKGRTRRSEAPVAAPLAVERPVDVATALATGTSDPAAATAAPDGRPSPDTPDDRPGPDAPAVPIPVATTEPTRAVSTTAEAPTRAGPATVAVEVVPAGGRSTSRSARPVAPRDPLPTQPAVSEATPSLSATRSASTTPSASAPTDRADRSATTAVTTDIPADPTAPIAQRAAPPAPHTAAVPAGRAPAATPATIVTPATAQHLPGLDGRTARRIDAAATVVAAAAIPTPVTPATATPADRTAVSVAGVGATPVAAAAGVVDPVAMPAVTSRVPLTPMRPAAAPAGRPTRIDDVLMSRNPVRLPEAQTPVAEMPVVEGLAARRNDVVPSAPGQTDARPATATAQPGPAATPVSVVAAPTLSPPQPLPAVGTPMLVPASPTSTKVDGRSEPTQHQIDTAPAPVPTLLATPLPQRDVQPAARMFAQAMFAAAPVADREEAPSEALPIALLGGTGSTTPTATPIAVHAAAAADHAAIDMTRADWMTSMIDRIETLRDESGGIAETRMKLAPDALGGVEVSLRRDDRGQIHVDIAADTPQARSMLNDAAPRLADMAEARGLKLGGATVDAGGSFTDSGRRDAQQAPTATPRRPASAANDADAGATMTPDKRLA